MSPTKAKKDGFFPSFFTFLIGSADRFALENRIFSALMLTVVSLCTAAIAINLSVHLPLATILVMVAGVILFGTFYLASRLKGYYTMHVWPSALGTLIILAILWKYNGGSTGGAHLFLIIAPMLFVLFIKDWQRILFFGVYLSVTITLLVLEYLYPSFVKGELPPREHFIDILASTVQTQLVVSLVMVWAVRQYQKMAARVDELRVKSEERFNEVANEIPVIICEYDLNWRFTYANKTAFEVTGYTLTDVAQGVYLETMVHPDHMAAVKEGISLLLKGTAVPSREYRIITKTGEEKTVLGRSTLIFTEGKLSGFRASLIDITEMKRLEDRLHQAEKMESIGVLAGGIAHDFNNILTGILTAARLIESDTMQPSAVKSEDLRKNAELIAMAATRAAELVKNLLIFSRQGHHETAPFDCNEAVRESLSLLSHSLDKKIEISLEAYDGPLIVIGDQSLLESAILNLAVNAQDAMPTGGMLTIRTFKRTPNAITIAAHPHLQNVSAFVAVSVSDTGKGIDDRIRDRLFEPFVTTKETGKGTGLGLSSVYGTAKALGGCIDVESEKGRGTTFTIYLPLSDRAVAIETPSQAMPFSGNGESIMIIDDEDIILKAEEMALTKQGYSVKAFSNPAFALDYYRDRQAGVTCVILDMVMPKMNGKTCFERLRAINPGVKVILTTGYAGDPDFDAFIKSSGVLFVPKPFDAQIMGKAIRKALGKQGRGGAA